MLSIGGEGGIVVHNTAQNSFDNLLSYPPENLVAQMLSTRGEITTEKPLVLLLLGFRLTSHERTCQPATKLQVTNYNSNVPETTKYKQYVQIKNKHRDNNIHIIM